MDYPFDTAGLTGATIDSFNDTYKLLRSKFHIEITGNINFHLQNFEVFRGCAGVRLIGSYVIKGARTDCYVLFVELHTVKKSGTAWPARYDCYDYQTWTLAYLKKDFGRVLIRPETLADKLIELIHPVELDFQDDKAFSDTFYVLVNDRSKADSAMDRNFRNVVMDTRHQQVMIEIIAHTLIIGYRKPVSAEDAIILAEFVVKVCSSC